MAKRIKVNDVEELGSLRRRIKGLSKKEKNLSNMLKELLNAGAEVPFCPYELYLAPISSSNIDWESRYLRLLTKMVFDGDRSAAESRVEKIKKNAEKTITGQRLMITQNSEWGRRKNVA